MPHPITLSKFTVVEAQFVRNADGSYTVSATVEATDNAETKRASYKVRGDLDAQESDKVNTLLTRVANNLDN